MSISNYVYGSFLFGNLNKKFHQGVLPIKIQCLTVTFWDSVIFAQRATHLFIKKLILVFFIQMNLYLTK